ncbi:RNB domain-containing ribonuclease [Campylobacter geochelonis]|uniref:RNB domain-containing ribonuclease n=1 Tax=Campylobacter geochelonis TaxID=1780362 RepID=UPI00077077F1|nr:ribonuclease R family protein [Campylobacter geochelonis]CZE47635.1 ribonuclease R [Campylobacter geochelonis]
MKTFLENLLIGVDESSITQQEKEILRNMQMLNAVSKQKKLSFLNDGFVCGRLDISVNGTGYINAYDKRYKDDIIVENRDINSSKVGDIVLAKLTKGKKGRNKGKILLTLKPAFLTSVVYTKKFGKEILGVNVKSGLAYALKATQKSLKQMPLGTLLKINNQKDEIVEVLGNLDDVWVDEKISLAIYNKNSEFSDVCEKEAKSFGDSVDRSLYPNRIDLRELEFCTIDPVDAKDFDDAIYYDAKKCELYVAIADVSEYVNAYTAIDKEAKFRGFSIYFPHKAIPMLPRALSENICSLKPDVDRLAFVFKITIDKDFNATKEELFEAIIRSKKRFNYDEVDEILRTKSYADKKLLDMLLAVEELALNLRKIRLKTGFDFRTKELRMSLDESGNLKSTRFEVSTPSHDLIEDCMLMANKAAAKRISKGIFRNHDAIDLKKVDFLLQDLLALGIDAKFDPDIAKMVEGIQKIADDMGMREEIDKLIIKAQKKAEYATLPKGHFGLGFGEYSHFTSPIRRYSDLILHRLLKANLADDKRLFNYLLLNIEETCVSLNELEREADKVAYDFMDRKFARWASERIGQKVQCYIDENSNITTAKLDDKIKGARIYIINYTADVLTRVLVEILEADIVSGKIIGRVVKKLNV